MSAGEYAEKETLHTLAEGLPDAYTLFHGVSWAEVHPNFDRHGELDVVIVNSAGDVALLEVKAGPVDLAAGHVFKRYGGESKDVSRQTETQFKAVMHRLRSAGLGARLMHFLVLLDQKVEDQSAIEFPRERIADAGDCVDLPGFIQRKLGAGRPDPLAERVCAFFENRLSLEPDVSALSGRLQSQVSRISGGLATWVPRIEAPSGIVRICATAGSGKTQLALRLLRDARSADLRAAYVCFNRPLAEHVREIAPPGVQVHSFHQLCWELAGRPAGVQDFPALTQRYLAECLAAAPDLDLLVIDEMQDLQSDWVQALIARLKPQARLYLLDDPEQSLYSDREEIEVGDAVVLRSQENYRTPQVLAQTINLLRLTHEPIEACSPWQGEQPGLLVYQPDDHSLVRATARAVKACLEKNYALADIVILTWRGREKSRLMNEPNLCEWRLQRFDGQYDNHGRPVFAEGDLYVETLRRFKGQSAPAVVLTEIDFNAISPMEARMLFVGMTRATMHLELVMSEQAEKAIALRITESGSYGELQTG